MMTIKQSTEISLNNEPDPDNPWYRNRHTKHGRLGSPGILLPKRVVRPFWPPAMVSIDNHRMVLEGIGKRDGLQMLSGFSLLGAGITGFLGLFSGNEFPELYYSALIGLVLSLVFYFLYKRTPVSWYKYFERDTGIFETRLGFTNKRYRMNFSECEGRLNTRPTYVGSINYSLYIDCPGIGGFHLMEVPASSADILLGYWSFLVQYMDKNKQLPDVKRLSAYPNRAPGLGSWEEWEEIQKQLDFEDPYIEWLRELELNPNLDLSNYYRDNHYRKWNWARIWLFMYLTILALINLIYMFNFDMEGLFMPWEWQKSLLWILTPLIFLSGLVSYLFYRRQ